MSASKLNNRNLHQHFYSERRGLVIGQYNAMPSRLFNGGALTCAFWLNVLLVPMFNISDLIILTYVPGKQWYLKVNNINCVYNSLLLKLTSDTHYIALIIILVYSDGCTGCNHMCHCKMSQTSVRLGSKHAALDCILSIVLYFIV